MEILLALGAFAASTVVALGSSFLFVMGLDWLDRRKNRDQENE